MLCVSVAEKGFENIIRKISDTYMAEVRLEQSGLSAEQITALFKTHKNLIATYRLSEKKDSKQKTMLKSAIKGGAAWVDIEIETNKADYKDIYKYAKKRGCKVIVSYHNYKKTPKTKVLKKIIHKALVKRADLIKIATKVNTNIDSAVLLALYKLNYPLLVIGMGELGKITRIASLKLGAPFMFVCANESKKTAEGQMSEKKVNDILKNLLPDN